MPEKVPTPAPATDAYWLNLGKFISHYANVEWQLNRLVRHYYGINNKIANIILGQLRYDTAVEHLQKLKLAGHLHEDDTKEIDTIKNQLDQINSLRNVLVRYQITGALGSKFFLTTRNWAYIEFKVRTHLISSDDLDNASRDLFVIFVRIELLISPKHRRRWEQSHGDLLREPWQYTPSLLMSPGQESPSTRRVRGSRSWPSHE